MVLAGVAGLGGCAARVPAAAIEPTPQGHPSVRERAYTIWLGGARVGTAHEEERWTARGVELVRTETMKFLRGNTPVELVTTIAVTADLALVPSRVQWSERGGSALHEAVAVRAERGWRITGEAPIHALASAAIPAELVPLLVARDHGLVAPVFLPARGFVTGAGRIEPVAPGRFIARLVLAGGMHAEATIDTAADGTYVRIVDGEGVIAMAASPEEAAAPYPLTDLIAATAIPISGAATGPITILGNLALPAVPGQAARTAEGGLELELSPRLPGALPDDAPSRDRTAEIALVMAQVRQQITPDLAAGPTSVADAAAATAGDCTTYALAYAAHARERLIPTRLVTGLRVDGDHLIRHRWAVSWTGTTWIAVDAAFGAAPAGGDLIGLAVTDADDAGLVAGEAALALISGARR